VDEYLKVLYEHEDEDTLAPERKWVMEFIRDKIWKRLLVQ
jgi:hypothetical protein